MHSYHGTLLQVVLSGFHLHSSSQILQQRVVDQIFSSSYVTLWFRANAKQRRQVCQLWWTWWHRRKSRGASLRARLRARLRLTNSTTNGFIRWLQGAHFNVLTQAASREVAQVVIQRSPRSGAKFPIVQLVFQIAELYRRACGDAWRTILNSISASCGVIFFRSIVACIARECPGGRNEGDQ